MKNGRIENENEIIVIKCDSCDWYLHVESIDEVEQWLDAKCPKCQVEGIITPADMSILRQAQRTFEKTFKGEIIFPVDTAMSRNIKEARPFDILAEYPRKKEATKD